MTHVDFVDQTLRDGQQSLWGMRMRAHEAAAALPHLDRTGFKVVDLTGAGMFTVLLRSFKDDPWATTDFMVRNLPHNTLRSGLRTISVIGFKHTPDSVMDLWVQTMVKHGVKSFWIYDCLYDMPAMKRLADVIHAAGGTTAPAIMYGLTSVHDDEFFASRAKEMSGWDGIESVYVEDAAGVLKPERAATLLPALRGAVGDVPLELQCHNTTGLAQHNYIEGLKAGFDMLHTASRPLANGPSLPSTEGMVTILESLGYSHSLDTSQLAPVADHFHEAALAGGYELGQMAEYDPRMYDHQLPGGMTGTLKSQLAQHGMSDRFDEVLEEIPRVREELGEPIMATPFSQFVGIQALLNVVNGDRYSLVPDEVLHYALGHYGPVPGRIEPDVLDRILAAPKAAAYQQWERPQPTLSEIRARFGKDVSDEHLLLRFMTSDEEVDAMVAAGPIRTDPRTKGSAIVSHIEELVAESRSLTAVSVTSGDLSVTLRRRTT
ncbi:MAG: Pyruvate carboxylase [Humibacillus sp.]|nr:Pyruvate carboxylase [Humibacillus sp.]